MVAPVANTGKNVKIRIQKIRVTQSLTSRSHLLVGRLKVGSISNTCTMMPITQKLSGGESYSIGKWSDGFCYKLRFGIDLKMGRFTEG